MSAVDITIIDLDFPQGSKNKTATLITGVEETALIDTGFTRADGHRLAGAILDLGRELTTVFISHGDPDYYFGAEVLADAFPDARFLATRPVIEHTAATYASKLQAWAALGRNLPTRLVPLSETSDGFELEGHRFELRGGGPLLPDRHYLWQPQLQAIMGGVLVFQQQHVWVADTPTAPQRAAWVTALEEMAALNPRIVVPGHRLPSSAADSTALSATREYLLAFEAELASTADASALTARMIERYPDYGLAVSADIGAKVVLGEMSWD